MKGKLLEEVQQQSEKTENGDSPFIMVVSHYPVVCSQEDPHCKDALRNMPDLYK